MIKRFSQSVFSAVPYDVVVMIAKIVYESLNQDHRFEDNSVWTVRAATWCLAVACSCAPLQHPRVEGAPWSDQYMTMEMRKTANLVPIYDVSRLRGWLGIFWLTPRQVGCESLGWSSSCYEAMVVIDANDARAGRWHRAFLLGHTD